MADFIEQLGSVSRQIADHRGPFPAESGNNQITHFTRCNIGMQIISQQFKDKTIVYRMRSAITAVYYRGPISVIP